MIEPLPADIIERIEADFGSSAPQVIAAFLEHREVPGAGYMGDWLIRHIVYVSLGNRQTVASILESYRRHTDFRDFSLEFENYGQVCDGNSFLINSPEKTWISGVASLLYKRGYVLKSLQTREALPLPASVCDKYEGIAKFAGPEGEVIVEKRDHAWFVHGDPRELALHDLDRGHPAPPYDEWKKFLDALSGYVLSKKPRRN